MAAAVKGLDGSRNPVGNFVGSVPLWYFPGGKRHFKHPFPFCRRPGGCHLCQRRQHPRMGHLPAVVFCYQPIRGDFLAGISSTPPGPSHGGFQGVDCRFRSLRGRAYLFPEFHARGCGRYCRPVLGVHVLAVGDPLAGSHLPRCLDLSRFRGGPHTLTHFFENSREIPGKFRNFQELFILIACWS